MTNQAIEPHDAPRPAVTDRAAFEAELDQVRVREKAHTREGDAIAAARRRLPMVEVDAQTPLMGADGPVPLIDVFEGRSQLVAYFHMWHTGRPAAEQCEGCTFNTSHFQELSYLHSRDVSYAVLYEGPYEENSRYREFLGYTVPCYSVPQESVDRLIADRYFGVLACYLRDGDQVYETYWTSGRGDEVMARRTGCWTGPSTAARSSGRTRPRAGRSAGVPRVASSRWMAARPPSGRGSGPGATTTSAPCPTDGSSAPAHCTPEAPASHLRVRRHLP